MPTPLQIVAQLQECLPAFTDKFHDVLAVESASVASNVLTLTITAHGLLAGQFLLVNNALIRNKIDSVLLTSDDTLRFTTEDEHDLTAPMPNRPGRSWPDHTSVTIEGLQVYTLDTTEAAVPAKDMFETSPGFPLPTLSGDEFLLENRALGAKGFQEIASVTTDTVTINLVGVPDVPDGPIIIEEVITIIRIAMAPDLQRALEVYTFQAPQKAWCFVIMTDQEVSKERDNTDDLISLPESGVKNVNMIENFSILVVLPTDDQLSATQAQTLIYGEIFDSLLSCLFGWESVGPVAGGIADYNTAYYAHAYDWQARRRIDFEEAWENTSTVAFRIIDFSQTIFQKGVSNANIEL